MSNRTREAFFPITIAVIAFGYIALLLVLEAACPVEPVKWLLVFASSAGVIAVMANLDFLADGAANFVEDRFLR